MTKAISAVIATIMLLMTTVSLVGVFYVFSSTMAGTTTSSGGQQASQLTAQLSMCMQVDNIVGNQVTLRNCGKGTIENKSLVVMMDDAVLGASTNTIQEGNSSVVNVSGLWQIPFGKHSLKISNGAAVALALVDVQPNRDGLVGSWNFDVGSGNNANDDSGNGNVGTLTNMNNTGNATSGWTAGKFGKGLQFDGTNDYVSVSDASDNLVSGTNTIEVWIYPIKYVTYNQFMSKSGRLQFLFGSTGNVQIGRYTVFQTGGNAPLNQWTHVVATFDNINNNSKIYVNGIKKADGTVSPDWYSASNSLLIGKFSSSEIFNGTIDEVRIWNRAIAPDETVVMKQII